MYSLFNRPSIVQRPVRQPPGWLMTRRRLRVELSKVIQHCRRENYAVQSRHILVRLLTNLNVDVTLPLYDYYRHVKQRALGISRANGLVSASFRQTIHNDGEFYGRGSNEVYIYVEEDFNILTVEDNWKMLEPVRVLRHEKTSLTFDPLDGSASKEQGLAIFSIDIVKLAVQFHQYYHSSIEDIQEDSQRRTVMQFVRKYPLANGIISHFEISIMNRLFRLWKGDILGRHENPWPFYQRDYSDEVDRYLLDRLAIMESQSLKYEHILNQVTLLRSKSLQELIKLPQTAITRQNQWAFVLMRLPIIRFLVQMDYNSGGAKNRQEAHIIRKSVREMRSDRTIEAGTNRGYANAAMHVIEEEIYRYLT